MSKKDFWFGFRSEFYIEITPEIPRNIFDADQCNQSKAKKLYDYLDESKAFRAAVRPDSRSLMNVTFRGADDDFEKADEVDDNMS